MNECVVYLYRDPKGNIPRYVGVGKTDVRARFHLKKNAKTNILLKNMIEKRKSEGYMVEPIITYLGHDDFEKAKLVEIEEIAKYGREDLGLGTLFNHTDGGDGASNTIVSIETRAKRSASMKIAHADPLKKSRMSEGQKEASARPEVKLKRSLAQRSAQQRPEVRAKQLISVQTSETEARRLQRSQTAKIVQNRPEVKAKKSAALKISASNPEISARRGASIKAANTLEVRAKRIATMRATLARKKLLLNHVLDQRKLAD